MAPLAQIISLLTYALVVTACGSESQQSVDDGPGVITGKTQTVRVNSVASSRGWANTVVFYVDNAAPELVVETSIAAAKSWNLASSKTLLEYGGRTDGMKQTSLYSTLDDTSTVIYYDTNWSANTGKSNGVLATTIWENDPSDERYISRGDIIMNAEIFLFQDATEDPIDSSRAYDVVDSESVLVHEFGHLLGLGHVDPSADAGSVMHAKTVIGLDIYSRDPSADDSVRIKAVYGE